MTTTQFTHGEPDPSVTIRDAKRTVAIATEAEDQAYQKAVELIRSHIRAPSTCAHPRHTLSAFTRKTNEKLEIIATQIEQMMSNHPIPF